ncbi:glycosyltransferase family 4 protein [Candidatus Woesearchaeota archaeon]|nr:glycosyltransferase family 4 protein [Candidatus Woesearchaeota archaeon]
MKIFFFGRYEPHHARPHILMEALHSRGHTVIEYSSMSYARLLLYSFRLLLSHADAVVVTGKLALVLSQLFRWRIPVLFDVFISDYQNLVRDRNIIRDNSVISRFLRWNDKYSLYFSDIPFLDTATHRNYFEHTLHVSHGMISLVPFGALASRTPRKFPLIRKTFRVLFWGSFIPLHGIDVILGAAKILKRKNYDKIHFDLCGRGQTWYMMRKKVKTDNLTNVSIHGFVPSLDPFVNRSHVVLGVFSSGEKNSLMIQTKIVEAMAFGKAIITRNAPGVSGILVHGKNSLLIPPDNTYALVSAILLLYKNPARAKLLGVHARQSYKELMSPEKIGSILESLVLRAKNNSYI